MTEPEDIRKMRDCHKDSPIMEMIKEHKLRINFNFHTLFWSKEKKQWKVIRDEYYTNEKSETLLHKDEAAAVKALKEAKR